MNTIERHCLIGVLKERHRKSRKKKKGEIISKLCEQLGVGRKQAIRLLSSHSIGRPANPERRGRPSKYQEKEFRESLRLRWRTVRYP